VDAVDLRDLVEFAEGDVVPKPVVESERLWARLLCIDRNGEYGPVSDAGSDALLTVVAGEAVFFVDRRRSRLKQWGTALVAAGSEVVVRNASIEPLVVLMVIAPPPAGPGEAGP
jgi:hypothetical protein